MIVGYARTSTLDQQAGFDAQWRELEAAGVERIFAEQVSSVARRPKLEEALSFVREGDAFVCSKLDRLARSVTHLSKIVADLEHRGVTLRILALGIDTSTPTGKLTVNMLGAIAQFEREMMLERQREGIEAAKAKGRYAGRKPTAMAKTPAIISMVASGMTKEAVAAELGIGVASVYRALKAAPAASLSDRKVIALNV